MSDSAQQRSPLRALGAPCFWALSTLVAVALFGSCGDGYSDHVPSQKIGSELILLPDNVRIGDLLELYAVAVTPSDVNYITNYEFGSGIDVLNFDTGAGRGCEQVNLDEIDAPTRFEPTYLFPICLTIIAQDYAEMGERTVSIDVESGGEPVVSRGVFFVLPRLTYGSQNGE